MDIFLLIISGLAFLLFVVSVSQAGFNIEGIDLTSEGWNQNEIKRWLREAQKQMRLEKNGTLNLAQTAAVKLDKEPQIGLPGNAH